MLESIILNPIDILFTLGTVGFLGAEIKQFLKLVKHQGSTNAISRKHCWMKLFALTCVSTGYFFSFLWMSLTVSITEFILVVGITYYVYRNYEHEKKTLVKKSRKWWIK